MTGARTGRGAVLYGAAPASWWVGVVAGRVVVEVDRGGAVRSHPEGNASTPSKISSPWGDRRRKVSGVPSSFQSLGP